MKTKDFIELIQKEDPTGESHITINGCVPFYIVSSPGYYDGPYNYIDEDGNWVTSCAGNKVEVVAFDIKNWINELHDMENISDEDLKKKIKFDLSCYTKADLRVQREEEIKQNARDYLSFYRSLSD